MAKIFETQFNKGSLINKVTNELGTTVAGKIVPYTKGLALNVNDDATKDVVFTTGASANLGSVYSVVASCNINAIGATDDVLINIYASANDDFRFFHRGAGTIGLYVLKDGSVAINKTIGSGVGFKAGRNQIIILTINGTALNLWVDGVLVVTDTVTSTDIDWKSIIYVGSVLGSINPFNGKIYNAQIYNHCLSQQEIDKLTSDFVNSQPISKPKRGFEVIKPTDLSNLRAQEFIGSEYTLAMSLTNAGTVPTLKLNEGGSFAVADWTGNSDFQEISTSVETTASVAATNVKLFALNGDLTYLYSTVNAFSGVLSLPSNMTFFYCTGSNTLSGVLSLPSNMTFFYCTGSNTLSGYTTQVFSNNMNYFYLITNNGAGLSSSEVDQLIIDLDGSAWAGTNKTLRLTGTAIAAPTATSAAAIASLIAKGVAVTTN